MKWLSVISREPKALEALKECAAEIKQSDASPPDIAFLFPSLHHTLHYEEVSPALRQSLSPKVLFGCSAGGVIAGESEVEQKHALGLTCAWLPEVDMEPFYIDQEHLPSPDEPPGAWESLAGSMGKDAKPSFIVLADPFSLDVEALAQGLDFAFPKSVKIGGLASGALQPGENALYLNNRVFSSGAVILALSGNIQMDTIVAQGCRPIGHPLRITRCEQNLLIELEEKNALTALHDIFQSISDHDRKLVRTSLFLGILNDPLKLEVSKKDYLIRNLLGIDQKQGILAVGSYLRPGQMVQFHVRDREASAKDLEEHLSRYLDPKPSTSPQGALLFSCMGRGEQLYQKPNHDTRMFVKKMGRLPIGGFFCNGEIGPVDGMTYVHGYTSCFGIFRPADLA